MEIILLIIIGFGLWRYSILRGLLLVRAFIYLKSRADGLNQEQANYEAMLISMDDAGRYMYEAKKFTDAVANGKQMYVIQQARALGFVGGDFLDRLYSKNKTHSHGQTG